MPRADAIRQIGVTEQTYYRWRKKYGGMGAAQLKELKRLQKESEPCHANGPSDIGERGFDVQFPISPSTNSS